MDDILVFNDSDYEIKICQLKERCITYRAFEGIQYCKYPKAKVQKLNIFVPEDYYIGKQINGYDLKRAPIFAPNTVGGYMEGPTAVPGVNKYTGKPNSIFEALAHGYVVASIGVRGRNTGEQSQEYFEGNETEGDNEKDGKLVGRAPAFVVDFKAAIRFLRYNAVKMPGNVEHIVTNGTSAGGALSAIVGVSGNSKEYEIYLKEIGALEERDDIFAASCYCPIHNLENADMAYEWMFYKEHTFHGLKFTKTEEGVKMEPHTGKLTDEQLQLSVKLKDQFPRYVNELKLTDHAGNLLKLDDHGEGTFKEYIKKLLIDSAQKELETHWLSQREKLGVVGSDVEKQSYISILNNKVVAFEWDGFVNAITRMKEVPAFDALDLKSPENEEFGDEKIYARHFTNIAQENSRVKSELADNSIVKLLNPTKNIGNIDTARYWRIRHGAYDRDTSLAIPVILALLLENNGYEVDFSLPWGIPHRGDYDLDDLFAWIDEICVPKIKQ